MASYFFRDLYTLYYEKLILRRILLWQLGSRSKPVVR